jgi:hypothetical protein
MIMRRKYKYTLTPVIVILLFFSGLTLVNAQKNVGLRLNEILVFNETNCVDNYGMHSSWIEIYNPANTYVNIGGLYLTDDLNNPTKCWIPKGDRSTMMEPKSYLLIWADGKPERGIFHLNFDLKNAKTIALFDANGTKLLDKIEIAQPQKTDVTYGRLSNAATGCVFLDKSTPGTRNDLSMKVSADDQFETAEPSGTNINMKSILIALFAFGVIFLIYKILTQYFSKKSSSVEIVKEKEKQLEKTVKEGEIPGEVNAAIAMALYLYQNDLHDFENAVLTMQRVSRTYSPWSSKIYSLRKLPR